MSDLLTQLKEVRQLVILKHLPGQHNQGDHTPKKYGRGDGELTIMSSPLSSSEAGVVVDYKMGHDAFVNEWLGKGLVGKKTGEGARMIEREIDILDSAIDKSRLAEDAVLHRGTSYLKEDWVRPKGDKYTPRKTLRAERDPFSDSVGKTISVPTFMSTSSDEQVARNFADMRERNYQYHPGKKPVFDKFVVNIHAQKGAHALDTSDVGLEGMGVLSVGEREVMLPRGSKLRINSVNTDASGVGVVDATLVTE